MHGGHYTESVGLKLTPMVVICLLDPLGMFVPMVGTYWTHR